MTELSQSDQKLYRDAYHAAEYLVDDHDFDGDFVLATHQTNEEIMKYSLEHLSPDAKRWLAGLNAKSKVVRLLQKEMEGNND